MGRTGLLIALAIAVAAGVVFGVYPELDVAIARRFYVPGEGFWWDAEDWAQRLRDLASILIALVAAPAVIGLLLKLWRPQSPLPLRGRATLLMVATLIVGPLLTTNLLLKEHGGRPRPRDIVAFGGADRFVPWWDPRGACTENCSFVAGEPSGAAWTLSAAAVTPPPWRAAAYAAALAFTAAVGLLRIGAGGHFFSDVVFAGVLTFLLIWCVHGLLYRWRTRTTDAAVEDALARVGNRLRGLLRWRRPV